MKNIELSYILCAMGLLSPAAGLHRFYLGRPVSGLLYLMTWGFFGVGTILDLIHMPLLIDESNAMEEQPQRDIRLSWFPLPLLIRREEPSIDQRILRMASRNNGAVTVQMVAMRTGLPLHEVEEELDRLLKAGFCTVDFDDEGCMIYTFQGLPRRRAKTTAATRVAAVPERRRARRSLG